MNRSAHMTIEPSNAREQDVTRTLIKLADRLVEDFDVTDVLNELAHDCVRLLHVSAAGLLLRGATEDLHVVAASSEQSRLLELFQLQREQGPCLDCYRTRLAISVPDIEAEADRWPLFAAAALNSGYRSVHAMPLHLRKDIIGALNLFDADVGALSEAASRLGQALADMATITILQERALRESEVLAEQLKGALVSRVALEQAKGVVAERGGIKLEEAFQVIRDYARNRNLRLRDVSEGIIGGTVDATTVLSSRNRPTKGRMRRESKE
jgi:transcriptional regulator with GAF, ATPase, and Fis domain